jgi:hypothetical protein
LLDTPPQLKELWLHITDRCNLACSHCLFSSGPDSARELSLPQLKQHVDDGGTICLAADCWTKKRRKFIANIAYFIVKWRLIRAVISCKAVPTGQSITAEKLVVNVEVKRFVSFFSTEAICERLFKAGGQVLTSASLRLLGSRVESVLMTDFNSQHADTAGA